MTTSFAAIATAISLAFAPVALQVTPPAPATDTVQPADPFAISPSERTEILKNAAKALSEVTTAEGRFVQLSPDGSVSSGNFALRRPGRVRFEYDAPVPILIVADGSTVAMEDTALETLDRVPLASTPLSLLLAKKLDFETKANVTGLRRDGERISLGLSDKTGEAEGELVLMFDALTYDLQGWYTLDAAGGATEVLLETVQTGGKIDPTKFRIEDPEDDEDEF